MPNGFPNFRHDPSFDPHAALRQKLRDQAAAQQQQEQQQQKRDEIPASSAASISSERPLLTGKNEPSPAPVPRKNLLKEMVQAIKSKQR